MKAYKQRNVFIDVFIYSWEPQISVIKTNWNPIWRAAGYYTDDFVLQVCWCFNV